MIVDLECHSLNETAWICDMWAYPRFKKLDSGCDCHITHHSHSSQPVAGGVYGTCWIKVAADVR
jgi:hypothetical protein